MADWRHDLGHTEREPGPGDSWAAGGSLGGRARSEGQRVWGLQLYPH